MPSVSSLGSALSKKHVRIIAGLGTCLLVALLVGGFLFTRSILVAREQKQIESSQLGLSAQRDLYNRIDGLQSQVTILSQALQTVRGSQAANGATQDYVTESAIRELVQEHLFKTTTSRVGNFVRLKPENSGVFLDYIPVAAAIWKAYPVREFEWTESNPWQLKMTGETDFGFSIRAQRGMTVQNLPRGEVDCGETASVGLREAAQHFKGMYPDEDWSKPCDSIQVSAPLKGGNVTTTDPETQKEIPAVIRAYIFRPKNVQVSNYDGVEEYFADQRLATVLIGRENGYWDPSLIEWSLIPPLHARYNGYVSEAKFKQAQSHVATMLKDLEKEAPLYSGFCGYGDCY